MEVRPDYWWKLFKDEPFHWTCWLQAIEKHADESETVLDLGCGDNTALSSLRCASREVWGADFQRHPELAYPETFRLLQPDGSIPFDDNSFDLITARWVLEHVEHPAFFLTEVERVLRPGGVLLGHSINSSHYVSLIRQLFDVVPHWVTQWFVRAFYGRPEHDTFPTFYRLNTKHAIERAAKGSGLEVDLWQTYIDQNYFIFHHAAFHVAMWTDALLNSLFGDPGRIYFTVGLRKPVQGVSTLRTAA